MANEEKNTVFVELYDLKLSKRANERFGRTVTTKSFCENDLISAAVERNPDLNAETLRTSLDVLKKMAIEKIAGGALVQFGLGFFSLDSKGIYIGDHASWNPEVNSLHVKTASSIELRNVIRNIRVKVLGMASSETIITSLTDKSSGKENARLTPGGSVTLVGSKIRIVGGSPENGIRLIEQHNGIITPIPMETILINEPRRVTFTVPGYLPAGDYKLSLTTQYLTVSRTFRKPATCVFDYVLAVQ
jgi:hypothetical protein